MRLLRDAAPAAWLVCDAENAPNPFDVILLGPSGYDAYAKLDLVTPLPGATEPLDEIEQTRVVIDTLNRFTRKPDLYYFCAWTGYHGSFLPEAMAKEAVVHLPYRDYVLFAAERSDFEHWGDDLDTRGFGPPPAFLWPADRAWCFTSDVDPEWAGIAASHQAVDVLVESRDLVIARSAYSAAP